MKLSLPEPGIYVLAVSGGVDSMVLLDLFSQAAKQDGQHKLVIAHLDHGIRQDSTLDKQLVQKTSKLLGLPFVYDQLNLGAGASEAEARKKRYAFLDKVKNSSGAKAIVTAHHQDDVLETAIINIIRGSNRKGLTSLSSRQGYFRPLLTYSKADLIKYAKQNNLVWREDSTNQDTNYLRNYIRQRITPRLSSSARSQLINIINKQTSLNNELDDLLNIMLELQDETNEIDRRWFNQLPHNAAREVLASWFRMNDIRSFDKGTLERLVVSAKVGARGQKFPILKGEYLTIKPDTLALVHKER